MNLNFNLKKRLFLKTKVFLFTVSFLALILLIISSFYDKQIANFFVSLGKIKFFRYTSAVSYDFGRMILAHFVLPICFLIIFDGLLEKYKNLNFLNKIYKKRVFGIFTIYLIAIMSLHLFTYVKGILEIVTFVKNKSGNKINSNQIYLEQLITGKTSGGIQIILTSINLVINILIFIFIIKPKIIDKSFLEQSYYKPALTIIIGTLLSYLVLIITKHIFGRPGYLNVAGTSDSAYLNGLDKNLSVESFFNRYNGMSFDQNGLEKYSSAKYHEWGQTNNTLRNGINGFTIPEIVGVDKGDHYGDMDFPSGHVISFANGLSLIYLFYYSKNFEKNQKFNLFQKLFVVVILFFYLICIFGLMILMLHGPSDIAFSLFIAPIIFSLSLKFCKKKFLKKI